MDSISAQSKTDMGEKLSGFFSGEQLHVSLHFLYQYGFCVYTFCCVWDFPFFTFFGASDPDGSDPIHTGICTG